MMLRVKTLISAVFLLGLVACGGGAGGGIERENTGGGTGTGGGTPTSELSIVLALTDAAGETSKQLASDNPLTLTATVKDSSGNLVGDTLVTFSFTPSGLADFSNDAGTATTGTSGTATIGLTVGNNSGAGSVVATLVSGESASITFDSTGITQQNEQPASLDFFASSIQLASSGSDVVELIALVKNVDNVLMEGIEVTFSANQGASLAILQGTTAADGLARATLSTQNNKENRVINVTAKTANLPTQTLDIAVVGTQININGSSSAIINDPVPLTISVVDSDGKGIANQQVSLTALNGVLSNASPTTSTSGQVTVNYSASSAGDDVITAVALNAQGTFDMTVQQDDFSFTTVPDAEVELGTMATLAVTWLKNGAVYPNGSVTLTSSRGNITSNTVLTNNLGVAEFTIESDNAGFASVSATGVDSDNAQVSARAEVEFIATDADSIIVDATPDSIAPSGQTSTIIAVVRDPNGNLIKGKTINFLVDDVSGGTISPNQATTDRSGIASTVYTSNAVSSFEAVKVYATVDDEQTVSSFTLLTVGDRAFDISIGTGRLIEAPEQSSYSKEFSVFVTDPDSNPVANANMTFSAPPVKFIDGGVYRKGVWVWDADAEIYRNDIFFVDCPNEDVNGDGILNSGEDTNGDGLLTPGNVAAISSTGTTDANGQTLVNVLYAKQFGGWTEVDISVKAESAGSESKESQRFNLPVSTEDLTNEGSPPPHSPYGQQLNCNNNL
ncbi:Ig-like domain-containing protein [Paraglaciecola sp.]|uniref:Ig-like domain-containing protein n=1 Tax=Pseudomonadati TaxID=3379134 RepID=UPI00273E7149|nr:Ig-like domain-containing protein [Paraglaciecola sp.]MDP5030531.1 Ig-like domain-containing protein [Paraglaciecola sp.]